MPRELDVLDFFSFLDLIFCSVTNEDRLATPFNDNVLALGDRSEVNFDFSHGQNIGGRGHVDKEVCGSIVYG